LQAVNSETGANGLAFDHRGDLRASDGTTSQGRVWRVVPNGTPTQVFRVQPMVNEVNVVGGVGGVGRDPRSAPPATVTIASRSAPNMLGSQHLVANGLAFTEDGRLLVASRSGDSAAQRTPPRVSDEPVPARAEAVPHELGRKQARQLPDHGRRGWPRYRGGRQDFLPRRGACRSWSSPSGLLGAETSSLRGPPDSGEAACGGGPHRSRRVARVHQGRALGGVL
jgi:hypothetical protein